MYEPKDKWNPSTLTHAELVQVVCNLRDLLWLDSDETLQQFYNADKEWNADLWDELGSLLRRFQPPNGLVKRKSPGQS